MLSPLSDLPRPRKRLLELLAKTGLDEPAPKLASAWAAAEREWTLRFLLSPVEVLATADGQTVCGVKLARNRYMERLVRLVILTSISFFLSLHTNYIVYHLILGVIGAHDFVVIWM